MRFLYGVILGILGTVVGGILYVALAGGEYLLVLSPKFHDMKAELHVLRSTEQQRDQLAAKLGDLERKFEGLSQRFSDLRAARQAESQGSAAAVEAPEPEDSDSPPPTP